MRLRRAIPLAPSLAALLARSPAPVHAAAPPPPQQPAAPTIKVYARETVVDVTVTDAHGNPVHGLQQSDFTVKEDGKPQPIHSFAEYGAAPPDDGQPFAPALPPHTFTNTPPPSESSALNVLLLDGLNTAPPDGSDGLEIAQSFTVQTHVKHDAQKFLSTITPGTRVAIFGLSRNLRILQGISTDPALLAAAVNTMDTNMDGRAHSPAEWCMQQDTRNNATLEALQQIAAALAAIKGKKNLIWFSAGFPTITDPNVNQQPNCGGHGLHGVADQTSGLLKTYALLNAAQVAVFPIGARTPGLDIPNPVGPGIIDPTSPTYMPAVALEQLSFETMAEATGGAAYYNSNDLADLVSQAVDRGASYYTLSYIPPSQKYDNGHHSIKIALNLTPDRPGLHLTYRQSYDAVDPATIRPAHVLTLAADNPVTAAAPVNFQASMGRSMPILTQLLFTLQVEQAIPLASSNAPSSPSPSPQPGLRPGAPSAIPANPPGLAGTYGVLDPKLQGKPLTRYFFHYSIPSGQIAFSTDSKGVHRGSLDINLAAYDGDGNLLTSISQTLKMPLSDNRYQDFIKAPFTFTQPLDLPPGTLFLRAGIHDPSTNKIGTLELPITLPKPPK
jgi:VWFA-related protein